MRVIDPLTARPPGAGHVETDRFGDPLRVLSGLTGHYSAIHDVRVGEIGGRDGRGRLVRIYSNGTGPPVLAIPDLGSSAAAWLGLTAPLCAAGRQLVSVDLPGSAHCDPLDSPGGDVHAEHLAAITEQLLGGDRPAHDGETGCDMLGVGFGAYVVLTLATRRPDLVHRAVVVDPLLPPPSVDAPRPRLSLGMVLDGAVTTVRRGRPLANLAGLGRARVTLGALADPDPAWWNALPALAAPVLVVASGPAHATGAAGADALAARIPGARRADLPPGVGGPHRDPERLADLVVPFLRR